MIKSLDVAWITLGKILGPQGLKGWVKVYSYTRPAENIFTYTHWQVSTGIVLEYAIEQFAADGGKLRVKLAGVDDREAAERLKNALIVVDKEQLQPLKSAEFYWHQLLGLAVYDQHQQKLGLVKELLETGANDVLLIESEATGALIAVPWLPEVIKNTDLEAGIINVDWQLDD